MGLLDDAIREHLDLKRRRGADPGEIERAEREALGPVRRKGGETASAAAEPELEAFIEAEEATYGEPVADEHYSDPGDGAYDEPDDPVATDLAEAEPIADPHPPRLSFSQEEEEVEGEEPFADEDAHATRVMRVPDEDPPPAPPQPAMSDATAEYDVEDALAAEPGEGESDEEDVLEETPEFLQDTPDHDRLWFEQRPPRDFDFDG